LLGAKALGLLPRGLFQRTGGQTGSSGSGDLLHGIQIDIKVGAVIAERAANDDFSPLFREGVDLGQVLIAELVGRHSASTIQLAQIAGEPCSPIMIANSLCSANQCLHSAEWGARHDL
jgi:hypothetical protein